MASWSARRSSASRDCWARSPARRRNLRTDPARPPSTAPAPARSFPPKPDFLSELLLTEQLSNAPSGAFFLIAGSAMGSDPAFHRDDGSTWSTRQPALPNNLATRDVGREPGTGVTPNYET